MDDSERLDPDIRMFVAMIDAMAFVPIPDLQAALNALNNNVPDPRVLPLLDYFIARMCTEDRFQISYPLADRHLCSRPKYGMCTK